MFSVPHTPQQCVVALISCFSFFFLIFLIISSQFQVHHVLVASKILLCLNLVYCVVFVMLVYVHPDSDTNKQTMVRLCTWVHHGHLSSCLSYASSHTEKLPPPPLLDWLSTCTHTAIQNERMHEETKCFLLLSNSHILLLCMCINLLTCLVRSYTRVCREGVQSTLSVYMPRSNTHRNHFKTNLPPRLLTIYQKY